MPSRGNLLPTPSHGSPPGTRSSGNRLEFALFAIPFRRRWISRELDALEIRRQQALAVLSRKEQELAALRSRERVLAAELGEELHSPSEASSEQH